MTDDDEIAERAHQEPPRGRRAGKTLLWALTAAVLIILVIAFRISTHKHAPAEQGAIRLSSAPTQRGRSRSGQSLTALRAGTVEGSGHPVQNEQIKRHASKPMKTRAAVAFEARRPLEIVDVDLEGPKPTEVLVEIRATGVCHTDAYTLDGLDSEGLFPSILGHEGAGVVVEVGSQVRTLVPGDHVIPLYTPECRECKSCLSQKTNLCTAIRTTQGKGLMPDGTSRFSYKGQTLHHYMGCSTFSNYTVLPEIALARIRNDAPFDKACYIGCGVTTGVGAVVNTAKVEPGANCIVFGLGGIGLNVLQGLRLAGADRIIGVDLNDDRKLWGERFGMTYFVNPRRVEGDLVAHLVSLTDGGADYTFDCTGNVEVMRTALEACHRGWGESIVIGVAEAGREIATRPFQLVTGRVWRGSAFGGARGRTDVPKVVDWYMQGKIQIDPMITHTFPLERINEAFDLMHAGQSIRSVIVY